MKFTFRPLNQETLKEIDSWNYGGFVEEVLMNPYFDSFSKTGKFIGPGGCDGFAAAVDHETVGLFEFNQHGSTLEIGLALRPDLIGKGLGVEYVQQGIAFGVQHYHEKISKITLSVDAHNKAALRVYEKTGFRKVDEQENDIDMELIL
ncbi:GNAT family N-acetyltransferase [Rossellomorea aquimaris]|uniref:GNAT family N-acetyltransferase n=1 Tax=Rossellomorea aquimaris TaxID=189382 RepID=UPI001CD3F99E|nr:GNAT family N-acetyltransferase [Rossellomorea aquimaris]MCA1055820.1 GNAT family N-acetyltransferase [Rossellomorea aquimaris]